MKENRMATFVCLTIFSSFINSNIGSSGAFEVYYGDSLIFSKLKEGRMPSFEEILSKIEA